MGQPRQSAPLVADPQGKVSAASGPAKAEATTHPEGVLTVPTTETSP